MKHNEIEKDKHYRQHQPEIESDEEEDVTASDDELQNTGHESDCDSEGSVFLDEDDSMYGENIEDENEDEDEEEDEMDEEEFDYVDEEENEEVVGLKNQEDDALLERKATTCPEFNFNYKVDCR